VEVIDGVGDDVEVIDGVGDDVEVIDGVGDNTDGVIVLEIWTELVFEAE